MKTGGPLLPDTYTLTLRSAPDGFRDTEGVPLPLDGNGDRTTGDDFVMTFTVSPSSARVVGVPDFARGQVRDLRVRWALEEAGIPYSVRKLDAMAERPADYFAEQPFGQVPIFEENGFVLFESGAIVLHIGERSETLLPKDPAARARAMQWLIAALNSIEPWVMQVAVIDLFHANEEWAKLRRPGAVEFALKRLAGLATALGDKPYLDGDRFTAGDLMMTTVLRILKHTDLVTSDERLAAYIGRCTARPTFKRAFDAQIGDFKDAA